MTTIHSQKSGSCRCGEVTFVATGAALITMACHCKGCQRMTGSAFSLSEMFLGTDFEIVTGEPIQGGMKAIPAHFVCPECSSWIFTRVQTPMGELVNVRATMFDTPESAPPYIETCTLEKLAWVTTGAAHSYDSFPTSEDFVALLAEFKDQRV